MQDAGKSASSSTSQGQQTGPVLQTQDDKFVDYRWKEGRWDLDLFKNQESQQMDWKAWDSVRPAQLWLPDTHCVCRRRWHGHKLLLLPATTQLPRQQHWSCTCIKA